MSLGRPTALDDHLFRKIKDLVLEGKNLREIAEILELSYATMRDWEYENYKGFSDRMLSFKHERMIRKAEANLEVLQDSEDERVALQSNTFVLETLSKKKYSKRVEQTGKDGKDLVPIPILNNLNNDVQDSNSNKEDIATNQED